MKTLSFTVSIISHSSSVSFKTRWPLEFFDQTNFEASIPPPYCSVASKPREIALTE